MDGFSVVVIIQAMILRGVFIQHGKSHPFLPFFLSFFFLSMWVKLSLSSSDSLGQMLIAEYVMLPAHRQIGGV